MKQHRARQVKAAFTLVEMLIGLAIIGVLLAMLFSAIGPVQKKIQTAQGINNARELTHAALGYAAEHRGKMPQTDFDSYPDASGYTRWVTEVIPYVYGKVQSEVDGTFRCPGLNGYKQYRSRWRAWGWNNVDWINVRYIRPGGGAAVQPNTLVHALEKTPWIISTDMNTNGTSGLIERTPAGFNTYLAPSTWIFNGGVIVGYLDGHVEVVQNPSSTNINLFKK